MPALAHAGIVYFFGITLAILEPAARARFFGMLETIKSASGTRIAFDSNYRPRLWPSRQLAQSEISRAWQIADIALPSVDDEMNLFGDADEEAVLERFRQKDWTACAIKRGALGPINPHLPRADHPEFAPAEHVIDTTAAGDSFNGGFLAGHLQGRSHIECMLAGHAMAREVVKRAGAIVPVLLDASELKRTRTP